MPPRSLGRLPNPYDPGDADHPFSAVLPPPHVRAVTLPLSKLWRGGPRRLDQGQHGYCVGFAGANWEQNYPTYTSATNQTGIDLYMAAKAQPGEPWPGQEGTSDRFLMQALLAQGRLERYLWATSPQDLKDWVLGTGPVLVGTSWYEEMFDPTPDHFLHIGGQVAGGHEWLVRGYDHARDAYRMRNSWGASWGDYGEAWIKRIDLERLVFNENGDACAAIEKRP